MLHSRFHPSGSLLNFLRPDEVAKLLTFVTGAGYDQPCLIDWVHSDFSSIGMEFVWRHSPYNPDYPMIDPVIKKYEGKEVKDTEVNIIKKYINHPEYGILFFVRNKYDGPHWLCGVDKSIFGFATNDPGTGKRLYKSWGFGAPYKELLAFVILKKV
jgi:hypothetical protein